MTQEPPPEPRNWFFTLLIPAGGLFVVTAFAVAVVPILEQKARENGISTSSSAFADFLRRDGWLWLLIEVGVVIALSIAAMTWDAIRRSK